MKKAIQKAINNGFNPTEDVELYKLEIDALDWDTGFCLEYTTNFGTELVERKFYENSYYDLIFGTDFIDKLVGEGRLMCGEENRPCDGNCDIVKVWKTPKNNCSMRKEGLAYYWRREMANIKDINELKEKIRELM
jgi:hypothetical protein